MDDDEAGLVNEHCQREKKRSYKDFRMDEEELEEPDLAFEHCPTKKLYKEPEGLLHKKRQHTANYEADSELNEADSSSSRPAYPVSVPQDGWGIMDDKDIQDNLLDFCCPAEGSIAQARQSPTLECWVYLDNQQNMADCPVTRVISPPATPITHRPFTFITAPSSATASRGNLEAVSPMPDTCSPVSSLCSLTSSAWDTLRSTSRSPVCSDQDAVSAAAHLHLLGESLYLIGHHLKETDKMVSIPSSLSLLLDSLLCALAPLICLTAEIPELKSCTQHTLASTLENIAYVMPGM